MRDVAVIRAASGCSLWGRDTYSLSKFSVVASAWYNCVGVFLFKHSVVVASCFMCPQLDTLNESNNALQLDCN